MDFTSHKKKIIILVLVGVVVLCCAFLRNTASVSANRLASRNAADTLILLVELATESGPNYNESKVFFADVLLDYADHMERRDLYWLLQLPLFSNKNFAKELERVSEDLKKAEQTNARKVIEEASKSIVKFLKKSKPFTNEPIITFKPEVIPVEIQNDLKNAFDEAHKKAEKYSNNELRTVADARDVCMANRKAIVYLYLICFGHQQIINEESLETFRTDMNRTVYYGRLLQQTDSVKGGEGVEGSDYSLLDKYSKAEIRRLQLLQAIMDNDIQEARELLKTSIEAAMHDTDIFNSKP